jgi:hypothetical protein
MAAHSLQRAAIYGRVSTVTNQSTEMQVRDLRQLADRRGFEVMHEYLDEGFSGVKSSRPVLDEMLADAKRGKFRILLVWKLDRLGRPLAHLVRLSQDKSGLNTGQNRPRTQDTSVLEGSKEQVPSKAGSKTPSAAHAAQEVEATCPLRDWMPIRQWVEFLKARRKKPTFYEQELLISRIDELRRKGYDPARVLEQSIANRWQGVFPLPVERLDPNTRDYRNLLALGLLPEQKK